MEQVGQDFYRQLSTRMKEDRCCKMSGMYKERDLKEDWDEGVQKYKGERD